MGVRDPRCDPKSSIAQRRHTVMVITWTSSCVIERVLEAMEITSGTTRTRLVAFQLAGESLIWWDWVKTSRNVEEMTWVDFRELFMSNFFPVFARYVKT